MADKEITDITSGGAATSGDLVHAVRGANSRSVTLGDAAGLNVGTGVSTVAAGDDSRFGTVPDKYVTDAKLRDSAALSVIGRAGNSSGVPADIAAASDHQVLRRSGTSLAFGAVNLAQSAAVTGTLPAANLPDASLTAKGISELATAAEYLAGSDSTRPLTPGQVWAATDEVTLTSGGTVSVDVSSGIVFALTLGTNATLGAPTGVPTSRNLAFEIWVGATGATRTLTPHANWLLFDGLEASPWSVEVGKLLVLMCETYNGNVYIVGIGRKA